jgi:hypothetical protein
LFAPFLVITLERIVTGTKGHAPGQLETEILINLKRYIKRTDEKQQQYQGKGNIQNGFCFFFHVLTFLPVTMPPAGRG